MKDEGIDPDQREQATTRLVCWEREVEEIDLLESKEVKEEEEIRREVGERGAGGVARDRRASAELDRRAFIVG